jgi:SAM-dependent methyltransferase
MEEAPCPLGCAAGDRLVIEAGDRLHGFPGRWRVVECKSCGLRRTNPRPTLDEIGGFYPEDYSPFVLTEGVSDDRRSRSARLRRVFRFRDTPIPPMAPGRALELGAATGDFMLGLREAGWQVDGIEPSETAAERARARGLSVHCGPVETAPDPREPYDLVLGWMALEHFHDPVGVLRRLHSWTRPGARLAASTPNAGSLEARAFGDAWYALQLPTHLFHYTPRTISKLMAASGWKVTSVMHQRNLTNLAVSAGYRLRDRRPESKIARWLLDFPAKGKWHYATFPLATAAAAFGQTGRMTVWAERTQ